MPQKDATLMIMVTLPLRVAASKVPPVREGAVALSLSRNISRRGKSRRGRGSAGETGARLASRSSDRTVDVVQGVKLKEGVVLSHHGHGQRESESSGPHTSGVWQFRSVKK